MGRLDKIAQRVLGSARFDEGLERIAAAEERPLDEVRSEAATALAEMSSYHHPVLDRALTRAYSFLARGYSEIVVDPAEMARVRGLTETHTVVYLPSHRSNLDGPILWLTRDEHDLPQVLLFGGINMAFWPVGNLMRRLGTIFIRRSFRDDAVYTFALRHYVADLLRRRRHLEWYVEGGRSRTGKLRPPRLGLLAYVADGLVEAADTDVALLPVSVVYDHVHDLDELVAESRGKSKQAEGLRWAFGSLRSLRSQAGRVHVAFGEPISLRAALRGTPETGPERRSAVQRIALEVCAGINEVAPITPIALVTLTMLGSRDVALTLEQIVSAVGERLRGAEQRGLPVIDADQLRSPDRVAGLLETLIGQNIVTGFDGGAQPVFRIASDQHLGAAYYRNSIVHFLVTPSIAEIATLAATSQDAAERDHEIVDAAMRLRDLLKFEFFFSERSVFRSELDTELDLRDPDRTPNRARTPEEARAALRRSGPLWAHLALRPFLEAYSVVATHLVNCGDSVVERDDAIQRCLGLGHQLLLQRRIVGPEALSAELFGTALELAAHRDLLEDDSPGLRGRRAAFLREIQEMLSLTNEVELQSRVRQSAARVAPLPRLLEVRDDVDAR